MQSRIMVFIPAYNCEAQITRVLAQFDEALQRRFAEIVVVDNRSTDGTLEAARRGLAQLTHTKGTLLRNDSNYGLGGSHKVAFNYCLEQGYDFCIVLHGDDQGHISDIIPELDAQKHVHYDCLLGARFMKGSQLSGYSAIRTYGNQVFNLIFSAFTRSRLYDLGSGLNLFSRGFLQQGSYMRCADDLTFNYYLILMMTAGGTRIRFFPLTWREEDQVSNVKLVRQTLKMMGILKSFALSRQRFMTENHASHGEPYTSTVIYRTNEPADRREA